MAPVKKTPAELAGKWEMIKDTEGKDKRGLCLTIYPAGCFMVSVLALCLLAHNPFFSTVPQPNRARFDGEPP